MKTVILCGGKGTRYDTLKPKSLAWIGDKSIIHHLMEIYKRQGYNDFILALGWKGKQIKKYFMSIKHDYNIKFVETGDESNTGERIRQIEPYINDDSDDRFFCTYADGLANINLDYLNFINESHNVTHDIISTMTVVNPINQFGTVIFDSDCIVTDFKEKPKMNEYINGGFFIFYKDIFNYINNDKNESLEDDVLPRLVKKRLLNVYYHDGYWDTLNTQKDEIKLNKMAVNENMMWYDVV